MIKKFCGMEIKTYSTVSASKIIKINKCCTRCYRTLYNDIFYVVEGTLNDGIWYSISPEFKNAESALDYQAQIEKQIRLEKINSER